VQNWCSSVSEDFCGHVVWTIERDAAAGIEQYFLDAD
jgi:hypothetical protein